MAELIPVPPFDIVVFGGTGDLAMRKLMPALYHRWCDGQIPPASRIIAAARTEIDRKAYLAAVREAHDRVHREDKIDDACWADFAKRIDYVAIDAAAAGEGWSRLSARLAEAPNAIRLFYLATPPSLYGPISKGLKAAGLVTPGARVVLEKPIGYDLASAKEVNDAVGAVFPERSIFRIDHYLGKETVQNLLILRFANALFEPLWNRSGVDHVQITVAESIGAGGRASYYDGAGALRDMVQNHMLQLLCLVAMEPPGDLEADDVRDEKLKVLRALRPIGREAAAKLTVRGQYGQGLADGARAPSYSEELGRESATETFVALKAHVDNWRWAGVPFYLRTGKRMASRRSEIVVQFKPVPHAVTPPEAGRLHPNRLVLRLQPDEAVRLHLMTKEPGPGGLKVRYVPLNLTFADAFKGARYPDAYERLLLAVVRDNLALFMRRDEVEAAWTWTDGILDAWANDSVDLLNYPAGSDGPSAASTLLERDERAWFDPPR
jgi:glucose-6-phosphate 1-dehydrogenase